MEFTTQQLEAARACAARVRDGARNNYWDAMPTIDLPDEQRLGSGRWQNQAYPLFRFDPDTGQVIGDSVVCGDQDDPQTTEADRQFAASAADRLLAAIGEGTR